MSDTLWIHRMGGYGDLIQASAIIPFWQQKYRHLILETNHKGLELFGNDPRFDFVSVWEPFKYPRELCWDMVHARIESVQEQCRNRGWDCLNLYGTAEEACFAVHEYAAFQQSQDEREHRYNIDLYEYLFDFAGITMPEGWRHENTVWFDAFEEEAIQQWRAKNPDHFIIFCVMAGSGVNKVFPIWLEDFCKNLIDTLPRAKIFLFGDQDCTAEVWQYERTISMVHGTTKSVVPFKQSLLMTRYADFVFGPETGLLVGAGMMGTPKSMLFTLANKDQVVKHHRNDFSLQSRAQCSPCYTLAYSGDYCPKESLYGVFPVCTADFDLAQLKRTIMAKYKDWEVSCQTTPK